MLEIKEMLFAVNNFTGDKMLVFITDNRVTFKTLVTIETLQRMKQHINKLLDAEEQRECKSKD